MDRSFYNAWSLCIPPCIPDLVPCLRLRKIGALNQIVEATGRSWHLRSQYVETAREYRISFYKKMCFTKKMRLKEQDHKGVHIFR